MTSGPDGVAAAVRTAIQHVRDRAHAQFGWTHVELAVHVDRGAVALRGTIVARSLLQEILRHCGDFATAVDVVGVRVLPGSRFVAAPHGGAAVYRRPDRTGPTELATELDGDEPVEWLAEHAGATLVRVCDGTLGWTTARLVEGVTRPPLAATTTIDRAAIAAAWPVWIGAPYRLGGRRASGIDCSALVQRLLAAAALRVPRHSRDQLAIGAAPGPCVEIGTIVAVTSADEAPCHVGLAVGQGIVVHASRSRGAVVAEAIDAFAARASHVCHVPVDPILALQRRAAGSPDLLGALGPATGPQPPAR